MVNNSDAQGNFQTLFELREESNPRKQSRHGHWNPDRGSRNQVPGRWESVGDDGDNGDEYGGGIGGVVASEES